MHLIFSNVVALSPVGFTVAVWRCICGVFCSFVESILLHNPPTPASAPSCRIFFSMSIGEALLELLDLGAL